MAIQLLRIIDKFVIGLFILILFPLKRIGSQSARKHPKKILVIRVRALGSSLLTFPMIKQLEDHFGKEVEYDLLASTRNAGIFKHQGYFKHIYNLFNIKDLLTMIGRFKNYDLVIDTEEYFHITSLLSLRTGKHNTGYGNIRTRKIAYRHPGHYQEETHNLVNCIHLLKNLGIPTDIPTHMEPLKYLPNHTTKPDSYLAQFKNRIKICLHTGGAETSPDRFRANTNRIGTIIEINKKYPNQTTIFLSGTTFEEQGVQEILRGLLPADQTNVENICGKFSIFEFTYFLSKCDLMISNDTGPMHLAACMGSKTIGLFGPNLPERFGPRPLDTNISIYKGNGTAYINPERGSFKKDITNSINKIQVIDVINTIKQTLGNAK